MAVDGVDPHIDQSLPLTESFTGRGKLRDGKAPGTGNIGEELPEAEGEATTSCCRRPGLLLFQRGRQFYETQRKKQKEVHQSIVLLISNRMRAHKRGRFRKRRHLDAFLKDVKSETGVNTDRGRLVQSSGAEGTKELRCWLTLAYEI